MPRGGRRSGAGRKGPAQEIQKFLRYLQYGDEALDTFVDALRNAGYKDKLVAAKEIAARTDPVVLYEQQLLEQAKQKDERETVLIEGLPEKEEY